MQTHTRDMLIGASLLTIIILFSLLSYTPVKEAHDFENDKSVAQLNLEVSNLNKLSQKLYQQNDYESAIKAARQSLAISEDLEGTHPISLTTLRYNLARMLYEGGDYKESKSILEGSIELAKQELNQGNGHVYKLEIDLAKFYIHHKEYETAKSYYLPATDAYEKRYPDQYEETGNNLFELGELYNILGDYLESEATYLRAIGTFEKLYESSGKYNYLSRTYRQIGRLNEFQNKNQDAIEYYKTGLSLAEEHISYNCEIARILRADLKNPDLYSEQ